MDTVCGKCAVGLSGDSLLYDELGNIVCQRCLLDNQAQASLKRAADKVKMIAYSGPAVGIASFIFNPWWLVSVGAIGNGIYVFKSLRDPHTAKSLGTFSEKMKVAALAGMALGGVSAVLRMLGFLTGRG
jgi:hypothetical protein